jgi:low affinity Fe/Cu permease
MKNRFFTSFSKKISDFTGRPVTFALALLTVVAWGVSGPIFSFSDTWQLVINTGTTIITFLMVFLIQNAQNRDTHALQIKLDELIRVTEGAHTALLDLEELSDSELCEIQKRYEKIAAQSRKQMGDDTHVPHIELPGASTRGKPTRKRYTKRTRKK